MLRKTVAQLQNVISFLVIKIVVVMIVRSFFFLFSLRQEERCYLHVIGKCNSSLNFLYQKMLFQNVTCY